LFSFDLKSVVDNLDCLLFFFSYLVRRRVLSTRRLVALRSLQCGLLLNGFRLLRAGGVLVYSTCSFCVAQNQEVVAWLLERVGASRVRLLSLHASGDDASNASVQSTAASVAVDGEHALARLLQRCGARDSPRLSGCARFDAVADERSVGVGGSDGDDVAGGGSVAAAMLTSGLFVARLMKLE
jgi:hypothetical protein